MTRTKRLLTKESPPFLQREGAFSTLHRHAVRLGVAMGLALGLGAMAPAQAQSAITYFGLAASPTALQLGNSTKFRYYNYQGSYNFDISCGMYAYSRTGSTYTLERTVGTGLIPVTPNYASNQFTYEVFPHRAGTIYYAMSCGDDDPNRQNLLAVAVNVTEPTYVTLNTSSNKVFTGQDVTLNWTTREEAESCSLNSEALAAGELRSGSRSYSPTADTTYTLTCNMASSVLGGSTRSASQAVIVSSNSPNYPYEFRIRQGTSSSADSTTGITIEQGSTGNITLTGYVSDAASCRYEGNLNGGNAVATLLAGAPTGTPPYDNRFTTSFSAASLPVGTYNYRAVCDNPFTSVSSNTVTMTVVEPVAPVISNARLEWDYYTHPVAGYGFNLFLNINAEVAGKPGKCYGNIIAPDGTEYPKTSTSSNLGSTSNTRISVGSITAAQSVAGTWRAENVYCQRTNGPSSAVTSVTAEVKPRVTVDAFGLSSGAASLYTGATDTLAWQASGAASCTLRNVSTGETTDVPASGSQSVSFSTAGNYDFTLTCEGESRYIYGGPMTATKTQTIAVTAEPFQHDQISGQYLGQYHFFMTVADPEANFIDRMFGQVCQMGEDGNRSCASRYKGPGTNIEPAWWLWDFDKGEIWLGSSTVMAMSQHIPYRLYSPSRERDARQTVPETDPEKWQMVGKLTRGPEPFVYHVEFNKQIFFNFAGHPMAKLALRMGVANNGDGTLSIGTLNGHPSDKDVAHWFKDPYQVWESTMYGARRVAASAVSSYLGVPLPRSADRGDETGSLPAYNATFPFRVSPMYEAPRMSKVNMNETCETGGLPLQFYREFLRLSGTDTEVCNAIPRNAAGQLDSDADGLADMTEIGNNPVLPLRRDSIADFLQPTQFFRKPYFAGTIPLGNGERAVLYTKREDTDAGQELGNRLTSIPSAIWEPVPVFLMNKGSQFFDDNTTTTARLPTTTAMGVPPTSGTASHLIKNIDWETFGSIRLMGVNTAEERAKTYYLYFNKPLPKNNWLFSSSVPALVMYDIGPLTGGVASSSWVAEDRRIKDAVLLEDGHTIRFTLPPPVTAISRHAHIAIGLFPSNLSDPPDAAPRTDVAFDPQEPAYQALLTLAENQVYVSEPTARIFSFEKSGSKTAFTVGESVSFGWSVNWADQCRLEMIGPSGASLDAPWQDNRDVLSRGGYTYRFEQAGEHTFYLACNPDLVEESPVFTVTAFWGDDSGNTDPSVGTKPDSGGGAASLPLMLLLAAAGLMRRQGGRMLTAFRPALALSAALLGLTAPVHAEEGTPGISGVYEGQYRISIYGCPGACNAEDAILLGIGDRSVRWYFNFDGGPGQGPYAELNSTTLHPVGFSYEVQDVGNASATHNRTELVDNRDGTYTLNHGFQIFNPQYDNPRTDTRTVFRITRHTNGRDLVIETLDSDGDGIPGEQIEGVFPMTVSPAFTGLLTRYPADNNGDGISDYDAMQLGLNPYSLDTDGDGVGDKQELEVQPGQLLLHLPKDSDNDGVIDALEPGAQASTAEIAGTLPLLGGVVGHRTTEDRLSGETVTLSTGSIVMGRPAEAGKDWYFHDRYYPATGYGGNFRTGVMATGPMVIRGNPASNPESGKSGYGAPGLPYEHGYMRFTALPEGYAPEEVNNNWCSNGTPTEPTGVPENITIRLQYSAVLPAQDKLLVYAEAFGSPWLSAMPTEFELLPSADWTRVDDHTLDVTLPFDSRFNLASLYLNTSKCMQFNQGRYLKSLVGHAFVGAIAPTENTVGGVDSRRSLSVSGGSLGGGALVLLMLAGLARRRR